MNLTKIFGWKAVRAFIVVIACVFTCCVVSSCTQDEIIDSESPKEKRPLSMEEKVAKRAAYIENLNAQILSGKFVPNRDNGVQMRSLASQTKYYSIVGGSNEQTLFFYDVSPSGFYSFVFKLYNDASSEEDAEFDVYAVNSDGTIGTHLAGQVNEIHPGSSKSTYVLSSTYLGPDFAVIVENDGWWWDTDVQITGRVVCNE